MPSRVILFSGHMIDRPNRSKPRFPPVVVPIAFHLIEGALNQVGATATDLAICGGAAGGDLIFAEASLMRGMHLNVYIPVEESEFLEKCVNYAGDMWHDSYFSTTRHPFARLLIMADDPSGMGAAMDSYVCNNKRMLAAALAHAPAGVVLLALWDGKSGDGPGGTQDMVAMVEASGGQVHIIDASMLLKNGDERR